MAVTPVKIIWGAGGMGRYPLEEGKEFLDILEKYEVKEIDTAFIYPDSEKALGELGAPKKFTIHSKAPGMSPHCLAKDSILQAIDKQLALLGVNSIETYFFHAPDPTTPIEESLEAINIIHKAGKFKHFGLSNFTPEDVQKIYDICKAHSYPLPTIYQGNYNPVARHIETSLFPLLRRLKIEFYAYSPLAGGFLVKDASLFTSDGSGRWAKDNLIGQIYRTMYGKPSLIAALKEWDAIATEAGVSKASLAYRWVLWHSSLKGEMGDGCIIGATRTEQLEETLHDIKEGPLPKGAVEKIEKIWENVRHEAPVDNYSSYLGLSSNV